VPPLAQLADPQAYRPCDWDLKADADGRTYWLAHFREYFDVVCELIASDYPGAQRDRLHAMRADYESRLRTLAERPDAVPRIDVLTLDELKHEVLMQHGFPDPCRAVKQRENAAVLPLLPKVLQQIDQAQPADKAHLLGRGLMAGNLFDLGAFATVERYRAGQAGFYDSLARLPPRPWLVDHVDAWRQRWCTGLPSSSGQSPPYRHVAFFVDNAGADFCLGCLPLVRWMISRGARVTLAANSQPALNDITAAELSPLLDQIARMDALTAEALHERKLAVAASGGTAPLLDLTRLSADCVAATLDADLILLHGMGRAVESNWTARFTCDSLRTAVLKDEQVAHRLGGRLFDCVFRFEPGGTV